MPELTAAAKARQASLLRRARTTEHRLFTRHDANVAVHGDGFNRRLAVLITTHVGTMWCAYIFAVIGVLGILGALTANTELVLLVGAVSGYFLQLVLLPIIIVGQNVQAETSDRRAEGDHETLQLLHEMNITQLEILQLLQAGQLKTRG